MGTFLPSLGQGPGAEQDMPLTLEPPGQVLLGSQDNEHMPSSCPLEDRAQQAYTEVMPALRQEDGDIQATLGYADEVFPKMN